MFGVDHCLYLQGMAIQETHWHRPSQRRTLASSSTWKPRRPCRSRRRQTNRWVRVSATKSIITTLHLIMAANRFIWCWRTTIRRSSRTSRMSGTSSTGRWSLQWPRRRKGDIRRINCSNSNCIPFERKLAAITCPSSSPGQRSDQGLIASVTSLCLADRFKMSLKLAESLRSHQILADSKLSQLRAEYNELYGSLGDNLLTTGEKGADLENPINLEAEDVKGKRSLASSIC